MRKLTIGICLVLACVFTGCSGSGGGGGGGGGGTANQVALGPLFRGLMSIATGGGAFVRIDWEAAVDEATPSGSIRYQVFISATAGGQDFDSPVLTTPAGATGVILSGSESPLIAVGQTAFLVVRALDGDGNSDNNRVELAIKPVAQNAVAYVQDNAAGGGTVGNMADPFTTIQAAIDAIEAAGGGVILVSAAVGGTDYEAELLIDDATAGCVGLFGGFPRFDTFAPGAGPGDVLGARDVAALVTALSADAGDLTDEDLVRVINEFASTFIDGFTFRAFAANENVAVRGIRVHIQISCCTLDDGGQVCIDSPAPPPIVETIVDGTQVNQLRFVGNRSFNVDEDNGGIGSVDVFNVNAETGFLWFQNNTTDEHSSSLQGTIQVPTTGCDILCSHNLLTGGSNTIDLEFDPADAANGGALTCEISYNEIRDTSSNAVEIDDLADVGANGSAMFWMHNNFTQGVSSDPLDLDSMGDTAHAGVDVTIYVEENLFFGSNSIGIDASLTVSADRMTRFHALDNVLAVGESELFEIEDQSDDVNMDVHNGGQLHVLAQRNVHLGGLEDLEINLGVTHGGRTDVTVTEITTLNSEDEGAAFDLDSALGMTSTPIPFPDGVMFWNVFNNDFRVGDDEAFDLSDDRRAQAENGDPADQSAAFFFAGNNIFAFASDPGTGVGMDFDASGGHACWLFQRNFFGVGGEDSEVGVVIDTSTPTMPQLVHFANNIVAFASGGGVEVDGTGVRSQFHNNTISFNGQNGEFGFEHGDNPNIFIHNCIISHNTRDLEESEGGRASFSLVRDQDPPMGFGNISGEPFFANGPEQFIPGLPLIDEVDIITDLFTLFPGSPCVDAGDPNPMHNDPDGSRNDMGAYGGPGAGSIGPLPAGTPIPLVFVGTMPKLDLFTGANLVGNTQVISLAFTRPVDPATIAAAIQVRSGGADVAGTLATAFGGNVVTFTPTTTLTTIDPFVEITISTALQDTDGQSLRYPIATCRFAVLPGQTIAEVEPNDVDDGVIDVNDINAAQDLGTGPGPDVFRVDGDLSDSTDVDTYCFTMNAGDRIQARMFGTDIGAVCTPHLELRDANGDLIVEGGVGVFENMGSNDPFLDYVAATTGTVYLVVHDPDDSPQNDYELVVEID